MDYINPSNLYTKKVTYIMNAKGCTITVFIPKYNYSFKLLPYICGKIKSYIYASYNFNAYFIFIINYIHA